MRTALAALVLCACSPAFAADKPVPKYDGKPLEYWVTKLQRAETDNERDAAARALTAFGPDAAPAVPTFIEMLADHSESYRARVIGIIAAIGPKAKDARPVIVKLIQDKKAGWYSDAVAAVVAISSDPRDAAKTLVPLLEIAIYDGHVYSALCKLGPDAKEAIPAVRKYVLAEVAAHQKNKDTPLPTFHELSDLGPPVVPLLVEMLDGCGWRAQYAALGCLTALGPDAKDAVPALVKLLKDDEPETRLRTATTLCAIEKHPAAVAALAELVRGDPCVTYHPPNENSRWTTRRVAADAARTLGEIGPNAKDALPQLREAAALGWMFWFVTRGGNSPYQQVNKGSLAVFVPNDPLDEKYKRWQSVEAYIETGRAALEAIAKIDPKPKK